MNTVRARLARLEGAEALTREAFARCGVAPLAGGDVGALLASLDDAELGRLIEVLEEGTSRAGRERLQEWLRTLSDEDLATVIAGSQPRGET